MKKKLVSSHSQNHLQYAQSHQQNTKFRQELGLIKEKSSQLRQFIDQEKKKSKIVTRYQSEQLLRVKNQDSQLLYRISMATDNNKKLNYEINKLEHEIQQQAINTQKRKEQQNIEKLKKKSKNLEHSTDNMFTKINQSKSQIQLLKGQVDTYRRERVIYDNVFRKIENDVQKKQQGLEKVMAKMIKEEQKNFVYLEKVNKMKQSIYDEQRNLMSQIFLDEESINMEQQRIINLSQKQSHNVSLHQKNINDDSFQSVSTNLTKKPINSSHSIQSKKNQRIFSIQNTLQTESEKTKFLTFQKIIKKFHSDVLISDFDLLILDIEASHNKDINKEIYEKCIKNQDELEKLNAQIKLIQEQIQDESNEKNTQDSYQQLDKSTLSIIEEDKNDNHIKKQNQQLYEQNQKLEVIVKKSLDACEYLQQTLPDLLISLGYEYKDEEENEFSPIDALRQMTFLQDHIFRIFDIQDIKKIEEKTIKNTNTKISQNLSQLEIDNQNKKRQNYINKMKQINSRKKDKNDKFLDSFYLNNDQQKNDVQYMYKKNKPNKLIPQNIENQIKFLEKVESLAIDQSKLRDNIKKILKNETLQLYDSTNSNKKDEN